MENKRCNWSDSETKELLSIMKEKRIMHLLDGKTRRNRRVYVLLCNEMAKKGYQKTSQQVKLKFRTLKKSFFDKKHGNINGTVGRQAIQNFNDLEELLSDRPVAAVNGLDTSDQDLNQFKMECEAIDERTNASISSFHSSTEFIKYPPRISNFTFDDECEGVQIDISAATETFETSEKNAKNKKIDIQQTLKDLTDEIKEFHKSYIRISKEQDAKFMSEQRRLQAEYLRETREMMAEDRKQTKDMMLEILKNI